MAIPCWKRGLIHLLKCTALSYWSVQETLVATMSCMSKIYSHRYPRTNQHAPHALRSAAIYLVRVFISWSRIHAAVLLKLHNHHPRVFPLARKWSRHRSTSQARERFRLVEGVRLEWNIFLNFFVKKSMKTIANHANTVENTVKSVETTKKQLKIMKNVSFKSNTFYWVRTWETGH